VHAIICPYCRVDTLYINTHMHTHTHSTSARSYYAEPLFLLSQVPYEPTIPNQNTTHSSISTYGVFAWLSSWQVGVDGGCAVRVRCLCLQFCVCECGYGCAVCYGVCGRLHCILCVCLVCVCECVFVCVCVCMCVCLCVCVCVNCRMCQQCDNKRADILPHAS